MLLFSLIDFFKHKFFISGLTDSTLYIGKRHNRQCLCMFLSGVKFAFLATLVALHFTLVSKSVSESVSES